MASLLSGSISGFFLHDVAEGIDLAAAGRLVGTASPSKFSQKAPAPSYIQYAHPPLTIDGRDVGMPQFADADVRFKVFDYGVVSVALTKPAPESWDEMLDEGIRWHEDTERAPAAEQMCRRLLQLIEPALLGPRSTFLAEDYLVFAVTQISEAGSAEDLITTRGLDIAQLLRGEREPLSATERTEVLRHRISYLDSDLVIPTWSAAFVYDTDSGVQAVSNILEYASSQLLQFRYYDQLLDAELVRIYARLQQPGWFHNWFARRYTQAARQVHALFIDVNELTDKTENALKIAGDVYAARLLTLSAARMGLDQWKDNVREKLKTLDDIYRFAVEQTAMARGEALELMIVLILVFELILFFAGIMR